ncbi:MAG: YgaP family membrane protein [Litorivicinaceae bacterium]
MKANVGGADKWARILGGSFLLGLVMVGAIGSWGLIGLIALATGLVERCGLYSIIGMSTCKMND